MKNSHLPEGPAVSECLCRLVFWPSCASSPPADCVAGGGAGRFTNGRFTPGSFLAADGALCLFCTHQRRQTYQALLLYPGAALPCQILRAARIVVNCTFAARACLAASIGDNLGLLTSSITLQQIIRNVVNALQSVNSCLRMHV